MKKIILILVMMMSLFLGCKKEDDMLTYESPVVTPKPTEIKYDHNFRYYCSGYGHYYPYVEMKVIKQDTTIVSYNSQITGTTYGSFGVNNGDSISLKASCHILYDGFLSLCNGIVVAIYIDTSLIKDTYVEGTDFKYNKRF